LFAGDNDTNLSAGPGSFNDEKIASIRFNRFSYPLFISGRYWDIRCPLFVFLAADALFFNEDFFFFDRKNTGIWRGISLGLALISKFIASSVRV